MTRNTLRHTISALALSAILGGVAVAQTAPTAPGAPEVPAAAAPAAPAPATPVTITAETLPAPLAALGLTNIEIEQGKRGGTKIEGDLPDGNEIEAMIDPTGTLRFVKSDDDDVALPQSLIDALVPQSVRSQAVLADFARITEVGVMPMGVMVGGEDAAGEDLRAGFAQDGTLVRFGRGDDAKGGKHGMGGKHGEGRGKGEGRHGQGEGRGHGHGQMGGMPGAFGHMTGMQGMQGMGGTPAPLNDAAAASAVTGAGYTALGLITRDGPRTLVQATNPAGEAVTVELNPRGEIVRETAR